MAKTPQDGKFAEEFTGNPPLDWNRRADGTLVIITHDGKKVILSPEFLAVYKPTIRRAVMTEPEPAQSLPRASAKGSSEEPEPHPSPTLNPQKSEDWKPAKRAKNK